MIRYILKSTLFKATLVFLAAFVVHALLQFTSPFFADTSDSFYHAQMGNQILQGHVWQQFPWLNFTTLNDQFVDHHFLFHVFLAPFIALIQFLVWVGFLVANPLILGPKLAIVTTIAMSTTLFYMLLEKEKVPFAWAWLLLFLAVPYDFYFRLHAIRVQALSLAVLLLGFYLLWKKSYKSLGVLSFFYVWLYGGFFYLPIGVGIYYAVEGLMEKKWEWKPLVFSVAGMVLGLVLSPYFPKSLTFLQQQIFDTGLGYQINVGGEWRPYDTWYFTQMSIVTLLVFVGGVVLTFIKGTKQSAKAVTLFLFSLFFLLLTLKSKRFIEYWPAFAVLSSAYLYAPFLKDVKVKGSKILLTTVSILCFWIVGVLSHISLPLLTLNDITGWSAYKYMFLILGSCSMIGLVLSISLSWSSWKKSAIVLIGHMTLGIFLAFLLMYCRGNFVHVARDMQPDVQYVQDAGKIMKCIADNSKEGDIVMTDDWDIFPIFYFYNQKNYYIVGLDPVFMYNYSKALYDEFAGVSSGSDGVDLPKKIAGNLKASFVVMDDDHASFKSNIEQYPKDFTKLCENEHFTAFRVEK